MYAGLRNAGLWQRDVDQWTRLTNNLPGDDIAALWCDAEDALWIGATGHGLCRLKNGKSFSFQQTRVNLPRNICGIIEDELGYLWLASSEGIFRISRAQLNAVADGHADDAQVWYFDKRDGMNSPAVTGGQQPVVARSKDGKLWFATTAGLYAIDPARFPNNIPPRAVIEEARIDDQVSWKRPLNSTRTTHDVLEVPPNNARLEFRFTALSLTAAHRNRFRYQLQRLNQDWVEAGTSRVASYTRVPPGHYEFKVMAANHEGVWNEDAGSLAITVLPFWWQTLWFRLLVGFGSGALLFAVYRRRVQALERAQAAQRNFARQLIESQEGERRRISAELHDSLGQSLLVVKNYAVMALKDTTPPEKMRDQLREISDAASASIEEVRSIARALRPYQLDRFGLTKTLEDVAESIAKTGSLKIETRIDNVDETLSSDAEISIYRMVQEWLNNVVKHSHAVDRPTDRAKGCRLRPADFGGRWDSALITLR